MLRNITRALEWSGPSINLLINSRGGRNTGTAEDLRFVVRVPQIHKYKYTFLFVFSRFPPQQTISGTDSTIGSRH